MLRTKPWASCHSEIWRSSATRSRCSGRSAPPLRISEGVFEAELHQGQGGFVRARPAMRERARTSAADVGRLDVRRCDFALDRLTQLSELASDDGEDIIHRDDALEMAVV